MKEMRPTTGKVLLALFNILGNIHGMSFLDLFSGSGRVAFTAHEHGATVTLVESDRKRFADIIKKAPKDIECFCLDVRRAVPRFAKKGEKFDIVFADPPYKLGWGKELPELIKANENILSANGVIIIEHSDEEAVQMDGWECNERQYGGTCLMFCRRKIQSGDFI